jgi:hypothetical protein
MRLAVALVVVAACGSERESPQPEPQPQPQPRPEPRPEPQPQAAWSVRDFSAAGEAIRAPVTMLAPAGAHTQVQEGADGPLFLVLSSDAVYGFVLHDLGRDHRRGDLERVRELPTGLLWVEIVRGRLQCDHPHTEPATVEQVIAACRSAIFVEGVPWPELSRPDR